MAGAAVVDEVGVMTVETVAAVLERKRGAKSRSSESGACLMVVLLPLASRGVAVAEACRRPKRFDTVRFRQAR